RIEVEPTEDAPRDLVGRLKRVLETATGARWAVSVASEGGAPTLAETRAAERRALEASVAAHPLLQAVRAAFPEARITGIRTREDLAAQARAEALPELPEEDDTPDDWDPFED
ncbi:MAG: DNA polymerase III subunit gamma/tau, partial [Opitutales bacterium]